MYISNRVWRIESPNMISTAYIIFFVLYIIGLIPSPKRSRAAIRFARAAARFSNLSSCALRWTSRILFFAATYARLRILNNVSQVDCFHPLYTTRFCNAAPWQSANVRIDRERLSLHARCKSRWSSHVNLIRVMHL